MTPNRIVLTDLPHFVPPQAYVAAADRMVRRLAAQPGVICVQQLGHVSTPGISDLDMLVVFDERSRFEGDPLAGLSRTDRYLFVHSLFAASTEDCAEVMSHSFFHNYKLLSGTAPEVQHAVLSAADERILKRQIALEYLLRIFVSLTVEITYGTVKVRNLFLHAKAMLYDCEFLGITNGAFHESLTNIVRQRNEWFQAAHSESLADDIVYFHKELRGFLSGQLQRGDFFLPARHEYRLARHVRFMNSTRLSVTHSGRVLPASLTRLGGRRGFNLQHRFNKFEFSLPFRTSGLPEVIQRVFGLRERMEAGYRSRFPHFCCLAASPVGCQPSPSGTKMAPAGSIRGSGSATRNELGQPGGEAESTLASEIHG